MPGLARVGKGELEGQRMRSSEPGDPSCRDGKADIKVLLLIRNLIKNEPLLMLHLQLTEQSDLNISTDKLGDYGVTPEFLLSLVLN